MLLIACPCCSCGDLVTGILGVNAGTWNDDPQNWARAFQSTKPDDVVVLHSQYWRSAHWSFEFQYFFEIERNDKLQKQLFSKNDLIRLDGKETATAKQEFFGAPPEGFAPKSIGKYEVWVYKNSSSGHFRVFIDKETGTSFLTDYSV